MPSNANVIIEYGPYNSQGIIEYKIERLQGLQRYLEAKGHRVIELKKAKNWNNVNVYVNEQNVFKCKLNELEFGGDGQLDPLAIAAEQKISNAY